MKKPSDVKTNNRHIKAAQTAALVSGCLLLVLLPEAAHANIITDIAGQKVKDISSGLLLVAKGICVIAIICIVIGFFWNKINTKWATGVVVGGACLGGISKLTAWFGI